MPQMTFATILFREEEIRSEQKWFIQLKVEQHRFFVKFLQTRKNLK